MTETFESDMKDNVGICEIGTLVSNVDEIKGLEKNKIISRENRVEIDTSPPFESVKEAVTHFGGSGVWRPSSKSPEPKHISREVDATKVEEQASFLQKDLVIKERETLEVLKELETTKRLVEELKLKLQSEVSESVANSELILKSTAMIDLDVKQTDEQTSGDPTETNQNLIGDLSILPSSSPGMILMELKQAKVNLSRTTSDLADIRASVESLNKKLEKERVSLKKTRDRLTSNSSKILSLEEELNRTKRKLELAKDAELMATSDNRMDISKELHQLSSEAEQFKKMAEATKSEVLRATTEIEQTKTSIKTAEIRWVAAKKLAEAARASEAAALAEIKALSNSECSSEGITLSFEEYSSLATRAREAEELSKKRVLDAEVQVDEANLSKIRILQKVEEAAKEVKTSEKALEKALNRVEAANRGKLAVEEALRKWRSEHGQKRRSVYNSSKFKNSCPSTNRRDSRMVNINGFNVVNDGSKPILKPTLSIGQILSRKLLMPDESDMEMQSEIITESPKVSLGEILGKQSEITSPRLNSANEGNDQKQYSAKRKKFGLTRFSLLLAKQNKKKKKQASPNSRWGACKGLDDA